MMSFICNMMTALNCKYDFVFLESLVVLKAAGLTAVAGTGHVLTSRRVSGASRSNSSHTRSHLWPSITVTDSPSRRRQCFSPHLLPAPLLITSPRSSCMFQFQLHDLFQLITHRAPITRSWSAHRPPIALAQPILHPRLRSCPIH